MATQIKTWLDNAIPNARERQGHRERQGQY
jgi:hypothetical protein